MDWFRLSTWYACQTSTVSLAVLDFCRLHPADFILLGYSRSRDTSLTLCMYMILLYVPAWLPVVGLVLNITQLIMWFYFKILGFVQPNVRLWQKYDKTPMAANLGCTCLFWHPNKWWWDCSVETCTDSVHTSLCFFISSFGMDYGACD